MEDTFYIPFTDVPRLIDIVLRDYRLSFAGCLAMVIARGWGAFRIRKHRSLAHIATPVWPLAFYWPVYVWAIEAPYSLWYELFAGANWGSTKEAYVGVSVSGWHIVYAGVLPLLLIGHVGAATQAVVNEFRCPRLSWQVGVPLPVVLAVLGAYFWQVSFLVSCAIVAYRWRY